MRNFWLPKLHTVIGRADETFATWITKEEFVFTSVVSSTEFTIKVLTPKDALAALAHDCGKMASAAFETYLEISDSKKLPKSCAWVNLSTYYGSFFAAHAILRLCGSICFQVDSAQRTSLERVADLFGVLPPKGFEGGFYLGSFDPTSDEIKFSKTTAGSSGSHNVMWKILNSELERFSAELAALSSLHEESKDYLSDLSASLSQFGSNGSWLSIMRNSVNYKLEYGAWFPYKGSKSSKKELLGIVAKWTAEPTTIKISYPNNPLNQQVATSTALVAICRMIVLDMFEIAGPKSFHAYGAVSLLKQAKNI